LKSSVDAGEAGLLYRAVTRRGIKLKFEHQPKHFERGRENRLIPIKCPSPMRGGKTQALAQSGDIEGPEKKCRRNICMPEEILDPKHSQRGKKPIMGVPLKSPAGGRLARGRGTTGGKIHKTMEV